MTEEIIIDGVDVAGCVRLQDDKISCDLGGECKGWDNCYYKQLKRLEQENFELKEKINKYYQQTLDDEILMNELGLEVDLRKKESDFYLEKLSNYRSVLEEIKTYLNTLSSIDNDFPNTEPYLRIQDAINEVLQ